MSQAITALQNSFKIPELKRRILFTLGVLAVYSLGRHIPTPGVDGGALAERMSQNAGGLMNLYDLFTGGAFSNATIFALGIMPYISVSIIFSLLVPVIPALEKLQRSGNEGQKKITEYTRYGTIGLCIVQSIGVAIMLINMSDSNSLRPIVPNPGIPFYLLCIISFTTGTAFIMWLGEQISEFGIGNGISLIIFANIISGMPTAMINLFTMFTTHQMNFVKFALLIITSIAVVAGAIMVTTAQRRIPVQYPRQARGKGMAMSSARNYLPLRVNQAGVIPIIFAQALLTLPGMLLAAVTFWGINDLYARFMAFDGFLYNAFYGLMIIGFTFFYTALTFNPIQIADELKKHGGVVMGVRPGRATAEFLNRVMVRVTLVGGVFLTIVALMPVLVYNLLDIKDWYVVHFFGGTSLLILVGVGLDTVRQIEQHLLMRHYDGFMKGRRIRGRRSM